MELTGGCLCGKTRYMLLAEPVSIGDCHCIDCRRSAGAPYVTWGSVRPAQLRLVAGGLRRVLHADRVRCFAECCGTHLFFEENGGAEWIDVTIASLDDPAKFAPRKNIWVEDKLPWVVLDPSIPSYARNSIDSP
jgi:hypothetical protein